MEYVSLAQVTVTHARVVVAHNVQMATLLMISLFASWHANSPAQPVLQTYLQFVLLALDLPLFLQANAM